MERRLTVEAHDPGARVEALLNGDRQNLGALLVIVCDGINLSPDPFRSLLGPENLAKTDAEAQRRG